MRFSIIALAGTVAFQGCKNEENKGGNPPGLRELYGSQQVGRGRHAKGNTGMRGTDANEWRS
jgi:hypothetical protein